MVPLAVLTSGSEQRFASWGIELSNLDLIDSESAGGLADDRIDDAVRLHRSRRALLRPGRRVGQHVHGSPPHRRRLIDQRGGEAGRAMIAQRAIGSGILNNE